MSFSLDEIEDTPSELPLSVRLMRETLEIIQKFLPNGLTMGDANIAVALTENTDAYGGTPA